MMPDVALFSQKSTVFSGGNYVDIVGAEGSTPSTPTIQPIENIKSAGLFTKFPIGSANLQAGRNGAGNTVSALTTRAIGAPDMAEITPITLAMFWSKVRIPENPTDCWEWTATTTANGYGRHWIAPQWVAAHRFAYKQLRGPIPDGLQMRHLCHNRLCCNPMHLEPGTAKENAQDSIDAGRFTRGTVHGNSKLTDDQVIQIRQNPEGLKSYQLAQKFGVSTGTISNIKSGKIWRHVSA